MPRHHRRPTAADAAALVIGMRLNWMCVGLCGAPPASATNTECPMFGAMHCPPGKVHGIQFIDSIVHVRCMRGLYAGAQLFRLTQIPKRPSMTGEHSPEKALVFASTRRLSQRRLTPCGSTIARNRWSGGILRGRPRRCTRVFA